jgi:hypothetical protein
LLEPLNQQRDDGQYLAREVTDKVPTAQEAPLPWNYSFSQLFDHITTTDCYYYHFYHWKYKIKLSNKP